MVQGDFLNGLPRTAAGWRESHGGEMRRCLESLVLAVTLLTLAGCGASPTAPAPVRARVGEFDPTALFARLAGSYSITFEADDSCPVPSSGKSLTYDVSLQPTRYRYLGVHVAAKDLVGDLWALTREDEGLTFRWNADCDVADTVGSSSFYLCGQGAAVVADGVISGFLVGAYRPYCTSGAHRFVFQRRN
jgi:hypothetical protein